MTLGRASVQAASRSEITDINRRYRSGRLADTRHHAKRTHAGERLRQGRAADTVIGDIDAAPAGQFGHAGTEIGVASDDDALRARFARDGLLGRRADGADHGRTEMGGPAGQQLPNAAGRAVCQHCRARTDRIDPVSSMCAVIPLTNDEATCASESVSGSRIPRQAGRLRSMAYAPTGAPA